MIETRIVPEGYIWTKAAVGQLLDADRRYTALYQRWVLAPGRATKWTEEKPKRAFRLAALLRRHQARIVGELERALTIYAAKPGHPTYPLPTALVNTSLLITGRVTRLDLSEADGWLDGAVCCIKAADFSAYFARLHPPKEGSGSTLPTAPPDRQARFDDELRSRKGDGKKRENGFKDEMLQFARRELDVHSREARGLWRNSPKELRRAGAPKKIRSDLNT